MTNMTEIRITNSNSNHSLKSAVDMPIFVLKRGLVCLHVKNEARFSHQKEINLRDTETKWPPTSICTGRPTQTLN